MNKVIVTGYIYNRPYENQMKNGGIYLSGSIASRSNFKDADGRTHVDFIPFKAYGKQADYISHFYNNIISPRDTVSGSNNFTITNRSFLV